MSSFHRLLRRISSFYCYIFFCFVVVFIAEWRKSLCERLRRKWSERIFSWCLCEILQVLTPRKEKPRLAPFYNHKKKFQKLKRICDERNFAKGRKQIIHKTNVSNSKFNAIHRKIFSRIWKSYSEKPGRTWFYATHGINLPLIQPPPPSNWTTTEDKTIKYIFGPHGQKKATLPLAWKKAPPLDGFPPHPPSNLCAHTDVHGELMEREVIFPYRYGITFGLQLVQRTDAHFSE